MSDWKAGDDVETFELPNGGAVVVRFPVPGDPEATNATEILAGAKNGKYREDRSRRIMCTPCGQIMSRVYVGPDDDGTVREWLLTTGYSRGGKRVPTVAVNMATENEPLAWATVPQCKRCKTTYLMYADNLGQLIRLGKPTFGNISES